MKIRAKTQDHITQTTFLRILAGGALAILIVFASTIGFAAGSDSGSSGSSGYSTEGARSSTYSTFGASKRRKNQLLQDV